MAILSWNEIRVRAASFVNDWLAKSAVAREEADAQTFENEFFHIFGIPRKKVAVFEKRVRFRNDKYVVVSSHSKKIDNKNSGVIDLFWKGHILIEMKSPGKNLARAYEQAKR
ncbi:MAG: hypothetical protein LBL62_01770, partial [Planctomycetaceae bacterium]|nr:hypothetical protein [Planctomycetaceae bacterium]